MREFRRWLAPALLSGVLAGSAAQAVPYTLASASVGAGTLCMDLVCTGGAVYTLSPTPQGTLVSGNVDIVGTSLTSFSIALAGPFNYSPSASHATLTLGSSAVLTSSNCVTVGTTAYCGATFRLDSSPFAGANHSFFTLNLTATALPEPSLAGLLALGALAAFALRLRGA